MKEVVDLYAKLVIGTFSFMGPTFTLLISLFINGIERSKNRHRATLANLEEMTTSSLLTGKVDFKNKIANTNKELQILIKRNKLELNLLKPKRQAKRLFASLIVAIIFIEFYYFQSSHFWLLKSEFYRIFSLSVSLLSFVYSILVLWQLFCTITKMKSDERVRHLGVKSRLSFKRSQE